MLCQLAQQLYKSVVKPLINNDKRFSTYKPLMDIHKRFIIIALV